MRKKYLKKNGGYAILFAVVIIGIITLITIGLSDAAYKQKILSSVAKDSAIAFYQADIASECALYVDSLYNVDNTLIPSDFKCNNKSISFSNSTNGSISTYDLELSNADETSKNKCFRIFVEKTDNIDNISTKIIAYGYNICDKESLRTVERKIEVSY